VPTVTVTAGGTTTGSTTTAPVTTATEPTTTEQSGSGVTPPTPPSAYAVPSGAALVSSSSQLTAALSAGDKVIELADGIYGGSGVFTDSKSCSLYAQHLGGATLTAGLVVGGNQGPGGATVEGLAFNIASSSATFQGGELNIWGSAGENTRVLDSTFEGNAKVPVGLLAVNPDGLVAQRLTFHAFTDEGIRASNNQVAAYDSPSVAIQSITDISVNGVSRSTPGASNGTAEAGVWVGEPVVQGVHRIKVRNVSWSGIWTGNNSWDTDFTDLDVDMSGSNADVGVAVYLEHFTRGDTFENFQITGSREGFNAEWNDGTSGNEAADNDTIRNGIIDAASWTRGGHTAGVYLDEGTGSTTITGVMFKNENWAGIGAYKNSGTNTISGNTYQLAPGAVPVTTSHI
jgi:hypothetical protein